MFYVLCVIDRGLFNIFYVILHNLAQVEYLKHEKGYLFSAHRSYE